MKKLIGLVGAVALTCSMGLTALAADNYEDCFKVNEAKCISFLMPDDSSHFGVYNENYEFLFEAIQGEENVYTTTALKLRPIPSINCEEVTILPSGTELKRVGDGDKGWDIVEIDNTYFFVYDEFLTTKKPPVATVITSNKKSSTGVVSNNNYGGAGSYGPNDFRTAGVVNDGQYRYTWYSQRVLPGGGLSIPGRHVDGDGYVRDGSGNLCVASSSHAPGTVVQTPFGQGVVYDSGCDGGTLDIYTDW